MRPGGASARSASTKPRLRLTRRGRLVLFAACLVLVGAVTAVVAPATQAGRTPEPREVVVVEPEDTLWSIAARHAPSRDPYGIIEEIRRLNNLPDDTIHPGHELVLP